MTVTDSTTAFNFLESLRVTLLTPLWQNGDAGRVDVADPIVAERATGMDTIIGSRNGDSPIPPIIATVERTSTTAVCAPSVDTSKFATCHVHELDLAKTNLVSRV